MRIITDILYTMLASITIAAIWYSAVRLNSIDRETIEIKNIMHDIKDILSK